MGNSFTVKEEAYRDELVAANINPDSFLATDYLNHFNEIVMLLEIVIDMPDLLEEAGCWKPISYVEHFESSGFQARELVIESWGLISPATRTHFESIVDQLNQHIFSTIEYLGEAAGPDGTFDDEIRNHFDEGELEIQRLLGVLNGIIHSGTDGSVDAAEERVHEGAGSDHGSDAQSQDEIDQLFD